MTSNREHRTVAHGTTHDSLGRSLSDRNNDLLPDLDSLISRNINARETIKTLRNNILKFQDKTNVVEGKLKDLVDNIRKQKKDNEILEEDNKKLQENNQKLIEDIRNLEETNRKLKEEDTESELYEVNLEITSLTEESANMNLKYVGLVNLINMNIQQYKEMFLHTRSYADRFSAYKVEEVWSGVDVSQELSRAELERRGVNRKG